MAEVESLVLPDGTPVKMGCVIPAARPMALQLSQYLAQPVPLPDEIDYASKAMSAIHAMFLNSQWGCCVISDRFTKVGVWSGNDTDKVIVGSDQEVFNAYRIFSPVGDQGCVVTEVLNYFMNRGLTMGGRLHKIDGYVALDNRDQQQVKTGAIIFGGGTLAFHLPKEWYQNAVDGAVWDTPRRYDFIGDHDVAIIDYNKIGVRVKTWGRLLTITWAALGDPRIFVECYCELGPDWYNDDLISPSKFKVEDLKADLLKFSRGDLPPWEPSVPPPPPVVIPPTPVPPMPPIPPVPPTPPWPAWLELLLDLLRQILEKLAKLEAPPPAKMKTKKPKK